ncbi:MAG: hypothetical protein IT334_06645 [Thermomicrobiales bacterium]|nr:hypothetical protein [Thermomicrobiales bacterium]
MPNWKFWERHESDAGQPHRRTAPAGEIPRPAANQPQAVYDPQRLNALRRRREALIFDVEQSELATRPDNPWLARIALLDETRRTVEAELALVEPLPLPPRPEFDSKPVRIDTVRWEDPAIVAFLVGNERIEFVSELDWAERGAYIARNELVFESGDLDRLLPGELPIEMVVETRERLEEALFIFASDLRRRAEQDEPMPRDVTLDLIIQVCPVCGDWRAWGGYCPTCTELDQRRERLRREIERIRSDANAEREEREKLADRLPVALRRLADTDQEIARIEAAR